MNRTTRIKTAQAPRMYNIDLTDQLDGVTQTFTLEKPINEQATYYVIWNGTTYRNDPQNTWFSFNEDWDELTTYFDHAPTPGAHRSLILVVSEAADGSDEGTEVYMDGEHQDFVQIASENNKVVSINGKAVSGVTPEDLQPLYDAIDAEAEARAEADSDLSDDIVDEAEARSNADEGLASDISAVSDDLLAEISNRSDADVNLQQQIDAISAASDVKDIVGTKADLNNYDTSTLGDNDIIKVLQDESENNATSYYRWHTSSSQFTLIGEEGPYYTKSQTDTLLLGKQDVLTAGSNISISGGTISATDTTYTAGSNITIDANNEISATDTTYSDFTGTDGTTAGASGLVPAPATTDAGKYLKADGTWETITIPQSGIPATATFFDQTYDSVNNRVASNTLNIGVPGDNSNMRTLVFSPTGGSSNTVAYIRALPNGGLTIAPGGYQSISFVANNYGRMSLNSNSLTGQHPNGAVFRIKDITDPVDAQDVATKNYADNLVISYASLNGAGAPTTATEGKYVGQLYYDTTNDDMYYCSAITAQGTTPETYTYTWNTIGGGPTVVQTIGTSTTDVMSQNAVRDTLFRAGGGGLSGLLIPQIGSNATGNRYGGTAIGTNSYAGESATAVGSGVSGQGAYATAQYSVAFGNHSSAITIGASAIGANTKAVHSGSTALGSTSETSRAYELSIGCGTAGSETYSQMRYIAHVADPQYVTDAANKRYVDTAIAGVSVPAYTPSEFNNLWENA